jgi:hypothetical protein
MSNKEALGEEVTPSLSRLLCFWHEKIHTIGSNTASRYGIYCRWIITALYCMLCQVKKLVQISCSHASSHDLSPSHLMFVFQGSIFQCRWLIAIDACREQTRSVINLTVITSTPAASAATSLTIESTNLITKKAKKDNFAVEEE